jgi:IS30 family transposase
MGEQYSQLSIDEREMIAVLRAEGKTAREIGRAISRSHSTIVRELERNSPPVYKGYYLAHKAEEKARERKCKAGERERLKSPFIRSYVKRKLESGWSPEQVSGRLKIDKPDLSISHEAIYQYVYTDAPGWSAVWLAGIRSVMLKLTAEGTRSRIYPIESVLTSAPGESTPVRSLGIGNQILLCPEPVRRR